MSESRTSLDPQTSGKPVEPVQDGESASRQELDEEVALQREEILRLRDLLIGKDAELGQAKGRVAELEDQIERYTRFIDRLRLRRILAAIGRRLRRLGDQSS